ncbi:MAG: apolipoprotein N-acyltransferase [Bacteroidales bacterium]|nr:apolipoprotein N-acyltransferase [Bacteroidales bacterium]
MKNRRLLFLLLSLATVVLMSLPWLLPHCGWTALVGLAPLLMMERLATELKVKHFWWWHYGTFVAWNAVTTWWVCMATVGGGIFAVLANALQMSLLFGSFRLVKRRLGGALSYIYLAAAWLAWEKYYLTVAQISWPWLVLGNAFADTTSLVQWYSVLGHLGGSLWVWLANLVVFGLMVALSDGRMAAWSGKTRVAAFAGAIAAVFGPMVWSLCLLGETPAEGQMDVVIGQPNLDPYEKFESLTQDQQDERLLSLLEPALPAEGPVLVLAPETFTQGLILNDMPENGTFRHLQAWLAEHPGASVIYGASAYDRIVAARSPHRLAYEGQEVMVDGQKRRIWYISRNCAIATDTTGRWSLYHKSKLVVGVELTPYPAFFVPLENALLGGSVMGRCVGQDAPGVLKVRYGTETVPVGCAICYESVYGEYCTGYVRCGARLLTVITNDAWWGNTAGYRQHLNYSRLRAIETRRWVARCGNTGISAFISPEGRIVSRTPWWEQAVLSGTVGLSSALTPFVRWGDLTGRIAVFLFGLLALAALFRPRR